MLREQVIRLACDRDLRLSLGWNLKRYLDEVVSWEVVAQQYNEAYDLARSAIDTGDPVRIAPEF
jgi:hypothetical protein